MKEQKSRTNVNFNSLPTCSVHLYSGGLFQCNSTALLTDLNHRERTRTKGCFETRLERLLLRLFSSVLDHHTFIPGGFVSRFCSLASAVVSGWLHCGRLDWNAVYTHIHEAQRDKLTTGTGNNTLNPYQCQTCQQSRLGSNIVFCSIVLPTRLYWLLKLFFFPTSFPTHTTVFFGLIWFFFTLFHSPTHALVCWENTRTTNKHRNRVSRAVIRRERVRCSAYDGAMVFANVPFPVPAVVFKNVD